MVEFHSFLEGFHMQLEPLPRPASQLLHLFWPALQPGPVYTLAFGLSLSLSPSNGPGSEIFCVLLQPRGPSAFPEQRACAGISGTAKEVMLLLTS